MTTSQFTDIFFHQNNNINQNFSKRINQLRKALDKAEYVLIGAGSGLSTAAGLNYGCNRFEENFPDFKARYNISDMYAAMFYPFQTAEEKWAYVARHIRLNRFDNDDCLSLYCELYKLVKNKPYFVITTNVDGLFEKSGFERDRIFAVQGDYGLIQCSRACHDTLYHDEEFVRRACEAIIGCRIPTELVPICPVCGEPMEVNIRRDRYFVEDSHWHESARRYESFVEKVLGNPTLLLELGVGYNTPSIIRFPFERMALRGKNVTLARMNRDFSDQQSYISDFIPFTEDIPSILTAIS